MSVHEATFWVNKYSEGPMSAELGKDNMHYEGVARCGRKEVCEHDERMLIFSLC